MISSKYIHLQWYYHNKWIIKKVYLLKYELFYLSFPPPTKKKRKKEEEEEKKRRREKETRRNISLYNSATVRMLC